MRRSDYLQNKKAHNKTAAMLGIKSHKHIYHFHVWTTVLCTCSYPLWLQWWSHLHKRLWSLSSLQKVQQGLGHLGASWSPSHRAVHTCCSQRWSDGRVLQNQRSYEIMFLWQNSLTRETEASFCNTINCSCVRLPWSYDLDLEPGQLLYQGQCGDVWDPLVTLVWCIAKRTNIAALCNVSLITALSV